MDYLVQPDFLIRKAFRVEGYHLIGLLPSSTVKDTALDIVQEWTDRWDEGDGFGSSDGTYMLKDFIDTIIDCSGMELKTVFEPYLTIVKK